MEICPNAVNESEESESISCSTEVGEDDKGRDSVVTSSLTSTSSSSFIGKILAPILITSVPSKDVSLVIINKLSFRRSRWMLERLQCIKDVRFGALCLIAITTAPSEFVNGK
jgi:hypothetical protein